MSVRICAVRVCAGEELLILTAPAYLTQAQALKTWKISRGIPTSLVKVNDGALGGPDTNIEIDQYIDQRYASCSVRPSYIILFGDSNDVPTFTMQRLLKAAGRDDRDRLPLCDARQQSRHGRPDSRFRRRPPLGQLPRRSPGRRRQDRRL